MSIKEKIREGLFMSVLIIAEISANHGKSLSRAINMIKAAKRCGVDAVKFQLYTPDTLTLYADNKYFRIKHPKWGKQTLYQLYKEAYTPWKWFPKLKKAAEDAGLVFFATAFDKKSVDFLEELGVPFHKIASFELVDLPLIEYAAKTKKPMILSTGMATISEINDAISAAKKSGAKNITLLKCVSGYPARPEDMNLKTIPAMMKRFGLPVGLSDHTLGNDAAVVAVGLGATIVEKHFTLSRKLKTADAFFSIEPDELKSLASSIRAAEKALGKVKYGLTKSEEHSRIFRRSIFVSKDTAKGSVFTGDNIRIVRPAHGIAPKYIKRVLGKRAKTDIKKGTPLTWRVIA
jgi:pseudaminic acid synthase